jgi:hypothetical protein
MYSFLLSLASQYGIILMPLDEITAWIDPTITEYAPTFGLDPMQFATSHDAHQAYNTMTHALAAKLTADVTFGPKFTTATFIVNHTEKNGFKILYEVLALVHPNLSSDTSKGPKNPHFEGDFHMYLNKFMNFLTFEDLCGRTYRDSEKVDLVIAAINASI